MSIQQSLVTSQASTYDNFIMYTWNYKRERIWDGQTTTMKVMGTIIEAWSKQDRGGKGLMQSNDPEVMSIIVEMLLSHFTQEYDSEVVYFWITAPKFRVSCSRRNNWPAKYMGREAQSTWRMIASSQWFGRPKCLAKIWCRKGRKGLLWPLFRILQMNLFASCTLFYILFY